MQIHTTWSTGATALRPAPREGARTVSIEYEMDDEATAALHEAIASDDVDTIAKVLCSLKPDDFIGFWDINGTRVSNRNWYSYWPSLQKPRNVGYSWHNDLVWRCRGARP